MADINTSYGVVFDKQSGDNTKKEISKLQKEINRLSRDNAFKDLAREASRFAKESGDASKATRRLERDLKKVGASDKEIKSVTNEYLRLNSTLDDTSEKLRRQQDQFDRTSKNVSLAGDFQSNLGAVRGLAGTGGAGQLASGLDVAGELVVLTEELPRLKQAFVGLPGTIKSAASSLGAAGLAFIAIGAATAIALKQVSDGMVEMQDAIKAQLDAQTELRDDIRGGLSLEDAQAEIAELGRFLAEETAAVAELERQREQGFADAAAQFGDARARIVIAAGGQDSLNKTIDEGNEKIQAAQERYEALTGAIEDGTIKATGSLENIIEPFKELGQTFQDIEGGVLKKIAEDEKKAVSDRERALSRIISLEEQANGLLENVAIAENRRLEDRNIRQQQQQQAFDDQREQALSSHHDKLTAIEKAGRDEASNIRASLSAVTTDANAEIEKANKDFMKSEIAAVEAFHREEAKQTKDANKERLRDLQDHRTALLDAELNNDVLAFIQEQARFKTESDRKREDESDAASERLADFQLQRDAAKSAREEEIAAIQTAAALKRAELNNELAASIANTQKKIVAEQTAFVQSEQIANNKFKADQARQDQADALADKRRQEDLQRQLDGINQKAVAEIAAIRTTVGATLELEAAARRVADISRGIGTRSRSDTSGNQITGKRTGINISGAVNARKAIDLKKKAKIDPRLIGAFALGGVIEEPTIGLLGEDLSGDRAEAVIPFSKSQGILPALQQLGGLRGRGGGSGGTSISNSFSFTVTDDSMIPKIRSEVQSHVIPEIAVAIHSAISQSRKVGA